LPPLAATASATAEVGIEMKFKSLKYPVLIGATHVPELNAFEVHADNLQNTMLVGKVHPGVGARWGGMPPA
jgi:hypothetical protein